MKTIEQTRRELFEKWLLKHKPIVAADMLEEGSFVPEWMFEAWCAALDAVEIHLPTPIGDDHGGCIHDAATHDSAVSDCRAAIEQTGLGLRVL